LYLGELPGGGTWGSMVGWVLAWYTLSHHALLLAGLCVFGYGFTLVAEQSFGSKDPKEFVLDEVCGMALSVLWLPKTALIYTSAFILFRFFDIWKPWPISRLQEMKHPFSIMNDDIAAGFFANIILQIITKVFVTP
jgi:phosphatidylglycerophosphatase A